MARGWESKSVEDQQASAEARAATPAGRPLTAEERERKATLMTLAVSRSRILQDLQTACHPNHRAMLETALADVDEKIRALSGS
jgi:ribosomal protein L10